MSKQFSSSSSSSSSSTVVSTSVFDVQFNSGLGQSVGSVSTEAKRSLSPSRSPTSTTLSGARRWEICYDELKFDKSLGKGAYGEVFAGTYHKSKVAVKVYDFRGELTKEQQIAVLNEADLMEGLRSEYLIGFRGMCFDPRYCLVMEYAEGGTLRARLDKSSETITLLEQMRWAMQISYGLHQLHEMRIVHRDLKAENILLDKSSDAKVADFGLSVVKSSSVSQSKKSGSLGAAGTLPWMAPELFDNKPNSMETDVFSLGILLWEIISRKVPFEGRMAAAIVGMALMGKRETLPEHCPEVFRLLITACWDHDPNKRPKAEIVGDQFEAALKSLESIPQIQSTVQDSKKSFPLLESTVEDKKNSVTLQDELIEACKNNEDDILKIHEKKLELPYSPEMTVSLPETKMPVSVLEVELVPPVSQKESKLVDEKALGKLLRLVAEGEQYQAEEIIKKDNSLLLFSGTVTDLSEREFKQITAFQYALWALDWCMWEMIQKYLPEDQQKRQFDELETKGTAYGKHFSLQPLIGALQIFISNAEKVWKYDKQDKRADEYWQKVVGEAQRLLPAHVVNEYCCPEGFKENVFTFRKRTCKYYNDQNSLLEGEWFTIKYSGETVGKSFAYYRFRSGYMTAMPGVYKEFINKDLPRDLIVIQILSKVRTRQLELLACDFRKIGRENTIKTPHSKVESIESMVPIITLSQNPYRFTAPKMGAKPLDIKEVTIFLQLVMEGEADKAEEMIKKNSSLLLAADTVIDLAGREFQQITAFQYALWSLDWYMWKMIQKYLPEEEQKQQFTALESKGTAHGKHFSLQPLISALQTYADKFDSTSWNLFESLRKNHWCKVVGGAQKLLPASVVYEYCRGDRSFNPCPSFTEDRPPIKMEGWLEQWNITTWNGKLCGDSFAFFRGNHSYARVKSGEVSGREPVRWDGLAWSHKNWCIDLLAIKSLWKTRTQQLELLASQFKLSSTSLTH